MYSTVFVLLLIYQIKHFIADYPLQTDYMLGKFKDGWEFLPPLLAHVAVHGVMTFFIVLFFSGSFFLAFTLALFDASIHFCMDRIKAGKKYLGRYKALTASEYKNASETAKRNNKYFWWALGFDQMIHHCTHYAIIACLVMR